MRTILPALLVAGVAWAAAPPARLTPRQADQHRKAHALFTRAWAEWKAGKRDDAVASMRQALGGFERVHGQNARAPALVAEWLGAWEFERGNYKEATAHLGRRWRVLVALLGEGHWQAVDARWQAQTTRMLAGFSDEQKRRWRRADALNWEVHRLWREGKSDRALPIAKEVLATRRSLAAEKHPAVALALLNLAAQYRALGDDRTALPLFEQARKVNREAVGEAHPDYATNLCNLAHVYLSAGDHRAALPLYEKALAIRKKALGEKDPDYAQALNNLAGLYRDMQDHKRALYLFRRALDVTRAAVGEQHRSYAQCLNNLAMELQDAGDFKAALPLCRQALEITRRTRGEHHPHYATCLNNLAILYRDMGDFEAAVPLLRKALEIYKVSPGEGHPHYATTLGSLGSLYHQMGNHEAALPLYKKALSLLQKALGERAYLSANTLNNLAVLYQDRGEPEAALPFAEEAASLALAQLGASAAAQSDRQQIAAAEHLRHRLGTRLSLQDVNGYSHALAWKGCVLLRQRQRRLFTALARDARARAVVEELQATARQLAALSASPRPARERLQALTSKQERLQARLADFSAEAGAAFQGKAPTPAALSAALPRGVVLVDYVFYGRYGITYRDGRPNRVRHLVAFVSRKGRPTVRVALGPGDEVDEAVGKWRPLLARGRPCSKEGARVKDLIWAPLEEHLRGAKVVLVSPDDALAGVPFAALPGAKKGTYLIEDVALAVVPVPQMLPELLKPVDRAKRLGPSLLVVGDVDYDRTSASAAEGGGTRGAPLGLRRLWGKLPGTKAEAAAVSGPFGRLFGRGAITSLSKGDATKAKVRQALALVRYAHLATHGFFARRMASRAPQGTSPADEFFGRGGVAGWHPLLLSGVVLSGANKEPGPGQEDGVLTALEVSEMELPGLELVVLSACETGLGEAKLGEGLLGLQRAFQVAGARTVVASLWEVDDRATQALMAEFYRAAWDEKSIVSKAEALRRAQLALLNGTIAGDKLRGPGKVAEKLPEGPRRHRLPPVYWAAFVLSGDWR